jgi:hypothetical protein
MTIYNDIVVKIEYAIPYLKEALDLAENDKVSSSIYLLIEDALEILFSLLS